MAIGILEVNSERVPGTVLLDETINEEVGSNVAAHNLKHDTGRNQHIILAPQPSDDPDDPLNWSFLIKELVFWQICFGMLLHVCVPAQLISAALNDLSKSFGKPLSEMAPLTGYQALATAAGA